jgi:hypothetical protein
MDNAHAILTITGASWNSGNSTLTVKGNSAKGDQVRVWNSYAPNQDIGTTTSKSSGAWQVKTRKNSPPNPVPCAVSATIDATSETTGPFPVNNAPPDCAPTPPGENNPPDCSIDTPAGDATVTVGGTVNYSGTVTDPDLGDTVTIAWDFAGGDPASSDLEDPGDVTYNTAGVYTTTLDAADNHGANCLQQTRTITVNAAGGDPVANPDSFVIDTTVIARNGQSDVTAPGVLINDTDVIVAVAVSGATDAGGSYDLLADGSFSYTPPSPTYTGNDSFTYVATDGVTNSDSATVSLQVQTGLLVNTANQNKFNIMMNYELGMHCTGFEFAYCCVLPPYNSIVAQVVRSDKGSNDSDFPMLLEGDPNENLDPLGRETVLREPQLAGGNFNKYVLRYWHDAQPRNDGRGKPQSSTLISAAEGNSLFMWNTVFDAADVTAGNALVTGTYEGATNVVLGDGDYTDPEDNYGSGWMNHFYIYSDLEGGNPTADVSAEADKIRLGLQNVNASTPLSLVVPDDCGPAFHPLGPDTQNGDPANPVAANDCGGYANGNLLTFSTDHGTVVYTQMKVLENLPVMLTSPRIWEALGLPLTPFEDSIDFFSDPGLVDEDSIRPYVQMKAQLHNFDPGAPGGIGTPVMDGGNPVIGFGTAPIDIPNCERCHSQLQASSQNSAQQIGGRNSAIAADVAIEIEYWMNLYGLSEAAGDSTWYPRLKGAAISILAIHDQQHGTSFTANWPATGTNPLDLPADKLAFPQNTRLGKESVICQKCHADNVIAVVKSANTASGALIPPVTEAIHDNHRNVSDGGVIVFADMQGRDGGCQGCHPAHRSDGNMAGYPITIEGDNFYATSDNRDANGGCFVGRDVHSNPYKDGDGAETAEHLNAVGQWLASNVFSDQGANGDKGIWCTNCHTQLGQEIWRNENMPDLVHNQAVCSAGPLGQPCDVDADCDGSVGSCGNIRGRSLQGIADVVAGGDLGQVLAWLDPTAGNPLGDFTHEIWNPAVSDANVATIETNAAGNCNVAPYTTFDPGTTACVAVDVDGDPSVRVMEDFCTTPDCVAAAQATLNGEGNGSVAVAVPFSAATDGRDHWLAPGEPHCADCHAAPYTEQSGNINQFPPFNYPRKASLMRYSRGHQDISCQGCHESIHGLYPVTPTIDTTSYAQAANLNADGSHGPVKCGSCHQSTGGIPVWLRSSSRWPGGQIGNDFDAAVTWAHTYTEEESVLTSTCLNCHGVQGNGWSEVNDRESSYTNHAWQRGVPRSMMDKAETELYGAPFSSPDGSTGVCLSCHGNESNEVSDCSTEWKLHLTQGRVAQSTWETVTAAQTGGGTCGW